MLLAPLLFALACGSPPLEPSDGAPPTDGEVDTLRTAVRSGGAAAPAAFDTLFEQANDWGDLKTQDRSLPATRALRAVAESDSPLAERAAEVLVARQGAIVADLQRRRVRVYLSPDLNPPRMRFSSSDLVLGPEPDPDADPPDPVEPLRNRRVSVRFFTRHAGSGPHPIVRLKLLDLSAAEVRITHDTFQHRPRFPSATRPTDAPPGLTAAGFAELCSIPNLVELTVRGEPVEDGWLEPLRGHPTLRSADLRDCPIGLEGCVTLATVPHLEEVRLHSDRVGDAGLTALGATMSLRVLDVEQCGITDAGLTAFAAQFDRTAKRPALNEVKLAGNPVSDAGFRLLPLQKVPGLDLRGTRCGDGALEHLVGRWATTEERTKNHSYPLRYVRLQGTAVTDAGLAALASAPDLSYLYLSDTAVTGTGFAAFAAAGRKVSGRLYLADSAFDDAGCAALAGCELQTTLECQNTAVTDAGLARLADASGLGHLAVGGDGITDAGLAALAECSDLTVLALHPGAATGVGVTALPRLRTLILTGAAANNESVAAAAMLPRMDDLTIRDGRVTTAAFAALARSTILHRLTIWDTPVDRDTLAPLADRWPNMTTGDPPTASLPLLVALQWPVSREAVLEAPWSLARDVSATMTIVGATDPWLGALAAGLLVRRTVPTPTTPAFFLTLDHVGLTDATLSDLRELPINRLVLRRDPITADAVVRLARSLPRPFHVSVWDCPAAAGDGPARIRAALENR